MTGPLYIETKEKHSMKTQILPCGQRIVTNHNQTLFDSGRIISNHNQTVVR